MKQAFGQLPKLAREETVQRKQLQFLRRFFTGTQKTKVIQAASTRRLAQRKRISEKREVAFTDNGRHQADS